MTKSKTCILMALSLAAAAAQAGKDSNFKFENNLRVGYDDNIYGNASEVDSTYVSDLLRANFKANFSQRTELLLYYSPEFIYRTDADPDFVSYHDLYGKLTHQASQVVGIKVSDRFRYQDKDVQTTGLINTSDRSYMENDLKGALDFRMGDLNTLVASAGYKVRLWDDSAYAKNNDYDQVSGDVKFLREVKSETTDVYVGVGGNSLSYDNGTRGGFDTVSAYVGADHAFNPVTKANFALGYQAYEVDTGAGTAGNDSDAPYLSLGLEYKPGAQTEMSLMAGYSVSASDNQAYNAQNRFNVLGAVKQDITAKISLNATLGYVMSEYEADSAIVANASDVDDSYINASIRASYEINRNHFVDLGYRFTTRSTDFIGQDYDRNRIDLGWRLSL